MKASQFQKGVTWCRECMRLQQQRRAAINYELELEFQGGGCAICHEPPTRRRLNLDHDHRTGLYRALLCDRCNAVLGKVDDDALLLRAMIEYLALPGRKLTLADMKRQRSPRQRTFPVVVSRREPA